MRVEEEMFEKVFGQSVGETLRETSEERVLPRAVLPLSPMLLSLPLQILRTCGSAELRAGRADMA